MTKTIYLQLIIFLLASCKTSHVPNQILQSNIKPESLFLNLIIRGKEIPKSEIKINLVEITNMKGTAPGTYYEVVYDKWIFKINREYINTGKATIELDNRIIGNTVSRGSTINLNFARKYFILNTGLDDIYLIPVEKRKR